MNYIRLTILFLLFASSCSNASIIQNTKIQRLDSDIELSWEYNPGYPVDQVDIWVLSGTKIEFDKNPARYVKLNSVKRGSYRDTLTRTGNNQNCYYRIVPRNTPQKKIFDPELNNITVAKFDLELKKGLNLIALPILPQGLSRLEDVIGDQLKNDQAEVVYFDNREKDYRKAEYINRGFRYSKPFSLKAGCGFFINTRKRNIITFVGEVTEEVKYTIYDGNNLLGNSIPQTKEINKRLFDQVIPGSDAIYGCTPASKAVFKEDEFVFNKEFLLTPGCGFWYQRRVPARDTYLPAISSEPAGATFRISSDNAISADEGSIVQFLTSSAPPNDKGNHVSEGRQLFKGKIGGGIPMPTGSYGTFNYFLSNCTGEVYVRVWDTDDISGSVRGKRYATLGPFYAPFSPSAPAVFDLPFFYLKNVCAAPSSIGVKVDKIYLKAGKTGKMGIAINLSPVLGRDNAVEPIKFYYKLKNVDSPSWDREYSSSGPLSIIGDNYFIPGEWYEIIASASNYFGYGPWAEDKMLTFEIPKWTSILQ